MTNALGERDRKQLWLRYHEALYHGWPAEENFWKPHWQIKNLLLVQASGERPIAAIKPYPLQKNRDYLRHFAPLELGRLLAALLALWHDSKRETSHDFTLSLERWVLEV